jgi:hypothetical protein
MEICVDHTIIMLLALEMERGLQDIPWISANDVVNGKSKYICRGSIVPLKLITSLHVSRFHLANIFYLTT